MTYNSCLRSGKFLSRKKITCLALLPKLNKPEGLPSSYRPLCLLDDVGKILEILLVRTMEEHITNSAVELSERQFGFRRGRLDHIIDHTVWLVYNRVIGIRNAGGVDVAVGLDIRNAFNTIVWEVISTALRRMQFPIYLWRIVESYLRDCVLIVRDDRRACP